MIRLDASPPRQSLPLAVLTSFFSLSTTAYGLPTAAQLIPTADGTGTVVTPVDTPSNGSSQNAQFNIEQGSLSADLNNQFHSFESFSLKAGETANFIAPATVQNIITRVSGGEASAINGLLTIASPSQANLFLLNPAGILFGPEATVNLPANLTATTASTLAFEQGTFSATQANVYTALSGLPTSHTFSKTPGNIANQGAIALTPKASLALIGSTVTNTGTLSAPGGSILLSAIPGAGTVRISQSNHLLTLDIDASAIAQNEQSLNPIALPALLTQPDRLINHLGLNADGTASLTADPLPAGSTVVSGQLSTTSGDTAANSTGGAIAILGNQIALLNATLSANSPNAGGTIRIGGDYQGQGTLPSASQTAIDGNTTISANATQAGNGGNVVVWANDTTQYLGNISATGGATAGNGGFVEVSGKTHLNFQGTVDTQAPNGEIGSLLLDPKNITIVNGSSGADDNQIADGQVFAADGVEFTLAERTLARLSGSTAVTLEATNNITVQPLDDKVLAFRPGTAPITFRADADGNGVGDFFIPSNHTIIAPGRSLSISGANLQLGDLNTANNIQGGNITLAASGDITTGDIDSFAISPTEQISPRGGNVTVSAVGNLTANNISTENAVQSGNVTLTSQTGSITATTIPSSESNAIVTLSAPQTISVAGNIIQAAPPKPAPAPEPSTLTLPTPPPTTQTELIENNRSKAIASATSQLALLSATQPSSSTTAESASAEAKSASSSTAQRTELTNSSANAILSETETQQTTAFSTYFNRDFEPKDIDLTAIQQQLADIENKTGDRSAIIYVKAPVKAPLSEAIKPSQKIEEQSEILLEAPPEPPPGLFELMLITAHETPIKITLLELTSAELLSTVNRFRSNLLTSVRRGGTPYLPDAQQLYQWLIAPLGPELAAADIDTLVFKLDEGLRTLPLAALHDGEQFLIEKHSLGIIPSLGLTDSHYAPLTHSNVLAMGASDFEQLAPLPAVALELQDISKQWPARTFLNEAFTRQNLIQQQTQSPAQIVHLATHAEFNAGTLNDSYIQLWDDKLRLSELDQMGWDNPALSLLVLSACSTATGSPSAELGFAGLALASGAQSVLASLWSVDDVGTLGLMDGFYHALKTSPVKAQALQSAQLAMLKGTLETRDFSHPYYWSSFTLIGSPW